MSNKSYRISKKGKILIVEILIGTLGIATGYIHRIYYENKKWDALFYPGTKIENIDVGGKTKEEGTRLVKIKYVDTLRNQQIKVDAKGKVYSIAKDKIMHYYDLVPAINDTFSYGKNLGFFEKHKLIQEEKGIGYNIHFTFNEDIINNFISNIEQEVNKPSTDAKMAKENGTFKIIDEKKGAKLDKDKLAYSIKKCAVDGSDNIVSPILEDAPPVTAEILKKINKNVASYSTSVATSSQERKTNIEMASYFINGRIVMPNEVFSFNDTVGERTKSRGFDIAPTIVKDYIKDDVGGGICQVSTTLYNALLQIGIKPLERARHSLPVSYAPLGLDATVSWGQIDFKFKNTLSYPIFIESTIENQHLLVNIYSNDSISQKTYVINRKLYYGKDGNMQTIDLNDAESYKSNYVHNGPVLVKVFIDEYEKGKLVDSTEVSEDYY